MNIYKGMSLHACWTYNVITIKINFYALDKCDSKWMLNQIWSNVLSIN